MSVTGGLLPMALEDLSLAHQQYDLEKVVWDVDSRLG